MTENQRTGELPRGRQLSAKDLEATTAPSGGWSPVQRRPDETSMRSGSAAGLAEASTAPDMERTRLSVQVEQKLAGDMERTTDSVPHSGAPIPALRELGRYMIVKQLGAGGMGVVYKAYDPDLDRKLAIKLLRGPAVGEARGRLLREAQAMAKLSHPNVVPVFDVGLHDDEQIFIAMDFVDGIDLRAWIAKPHPWTEVVDVFVQAGAGLAAAHAVGLIHRDFKPDNVLLSTDPATGKLRAQVADFGLARLDDESPEPAARKLELSKSSVLEAQLTHYGAIVGTPAYMSPEQHAGVAVDPRTDQFSFCVALFEALYGKRPFTGSSLEELAHKARSRKREPQPAGTKVPGWLYKLCIRGTMPDREDRFPKMEALLAELQAGRTRGRRKIVALAGLGLAAGVAGGTAWAMTGPGLCEGGPERVAAVWSAERQAKAEQAFAATKLPYAADAWTGTAALLDGYAREWAGMYAEACAATQLRGEQSAELMDLRMTCLQRRLHDMDALLVLFEGADKQVVKRAAEAAAALPGLRACADAEALRNGASAPRPTVDGAVVEALRERIGAARAKATAGKGKEAVPELEKIVAEAETLGDPSLTAPALLALARAQAATGADEPASASAAKAVWQAIADRDDDTLWSALDYSIYVIGYKLGRAAEAKPWIEHAQAVLRRRGSADEEKADLLHQIGLVSIAAGDHVAAEAPLNEAIALLERLYGPDSHRLKNPLNSLGAAKLRSGKYAEGQAMFERAVALAEKTDGPNHPDLAFPLNNLALAFERQNRYDEAIAVLQRTRKILAAINPDDPNLGLVAQNIGGMLNLAGKPVEAAAELKVAREHLERTIGAEHPAMAAALTFTGDVERALGDLPAARAAYARGCEIREKALGAEHPDLALCLLGLAEVDLVEKKFAEALGHIDRALALAGKGAPDPADLGLMQLARAKALRATGDTEKASEAAKAARAAFEKAGKAGEKGMAELTKWEAEAG